jgi:tetratricopeptide (TPR) repeat protein
LSFSALICLLALPLPAQAQIPDEFSNLKILPKDIDKRALIGLMRDYSGALGVRCQHCHVGENTETLEDFKFAADDKEAKRVARAMIEMTQATNDVYLLKTGRTEPLTVTCGTCHHGTERPQGLRDILHTAFTDGGVEAVRTRYQELHEKYHGKGAYNFGEFTLTGLAERIAGEQRDPAAAQALLDLNLTFHPKSAYTHLMKGRLHAMTGAREKAISEFKAGIKLDPDNPWAQQQLDRLEAAGSGEDP